MMNMQGLSLCVLAWDAKDACAMTKDIVHITKCLMPLLKMPKDFFFDIQKMQGVHVRSDQITKDLTSLPLWYNI